MLTLVENGELYTPRPMGRGSVLLIDGKIGLVGEVDRDAAEALGLGLRVIDARGCIVTPGLIDPHEHLLGGSGEEGFSTQSPEITVSEIVSAGITTVVGCLGVDTTMKTLPGLLGKVKALCEEGLTARMWTGGYNVPPTTITGSVRNDIMFIAEIIGCGEVAISDERSTDPEPRELARLVTDAHNGGMLSGKAGVTHFHVGDSERRLQCLRDITDRKLFQVRHEWLYATHVERSEELMEEALDLAGQGVHLDIDVVEHDLAKWLRFYRERQGPMDRLTISSDASDSSPKIVLDQLRTCVLEEEFSLEEVLPLATVNTASILQLRSKGTLEPGKDGDILVLDPDSLEPVEVIARGKRMMAEGEVKVTENFLEESERRIELYGQKN
ncbi:MAG TPA: amidohydrolase family protein [Gemmatimonadales bacterium]